MHMLPAVDIKDGKAVRLFQGEKDRETVYSDSPATMARRWVEEGATYLHVVDLDGAFDGDSNNERHIAEICQAVSVPVEVGGGVRSIDKAKRLLDLGVERVILGTKALESRAFLEEILEALPGRIHVGVDARDGYVATKGWTETSSVQAEDFLRQLNDLPVGAIIYTDISRDGALQGPNLEATARACAISEIPIIASGGVTSLDDIRALAKLPLFGIISGKALYDGRIDLGEAIAVLAGAGKP